MGKLLSTGPRHASALVPLAAVMWAACAQRPEPTQEAPPPPPGVTVSTDLFLASAMAALPPPGVSPADLPDPESNGAKILTQYCAGCHALPSPGHHSATDWPIVLRRMWMRMDKVAADFEYPVPSTAERAVLLPYLMEHALKVGRAELPAGAGRERFIATCGRCHALPDPKQHSPTDWVAVGRRMRQHSEDMLGQTILPDHFAQIVLYLERASRAAS